MPRRLERARPAELTLTFSPGSNESFVVTARSPEGEAQGQFRLPWDASGLAALGRRLGRRGRHVMPLSTGDPETWDPWSQGRRLFDALFRDGALRALLEATRRQDPKGGVRLRLVLEPEQPGMALLHAVPWELLYHRDRGELTALAGHCSVVRTLMVARRSRSYEPSRRLRVLALISTARDLDLDAEVARLRKIEAASRVETQIERSTDLRRIEHLLAAARSSGRPFHALHLAGHGEIEAGPRGSVLHFETPEGTPSTISGRELATVVAGFPTLRIVVLNACETGGLPDGGRDPFAGFAASLLQAGVPVVVAVQGAIEDGAAIRFTDTFYGAIARGALPEAAMAQARREIFLAAPASPEWVKPVLFLSAPRAGFPAWLARALVGLSIAALLFAGIVAIQACQIRTRNLERSVEAAQKLLMGSHPEEALVEIGWTSTVRPVTQRHRDLLAAAWAVAALARYQTGDPEGAVEAARAAARTDPTDASHLFNLGVLQARDGDPGTAIGSFRRALKLTPRSVDVRDEMALALIELNRPEEAADLLAEAISLRADDPVLHKNLGRCLLLTGRIDEAEATLGRALSLTSPNRWRLRSEILYWRARTSFERNDRAESCHRLEAYRSVDPGGFGPWAVAAGDLARKAACPSPNDREGESDGP